MLNEAAKKVTQRLQFRESFKDNFKLYLKRRPVLNLDQTLIGSNIAIRDDLFKKIFYSIKKVKKIMDEFKNLIDIFVKILFLVFF